MTEKVKAAPAKRATVARLALILLAVAVAGGTWALFEFVVWSRLPSELVGKWVVTDGPQEGATFDFYLNGAMQGRVNNRGMEERIYATIRVDGNKLYSTTRHPRTGEADTRVQTIITMTGDRLVLEDERGGLLKLVRAE